MSVRRSIHLRLCAGAVVLTLPVVATSSNAVSGTEVAPASAVSAGASGVLTTSALPFGGDVATSVARLDQLDQLDQQMVARRVQATGDQRLEAASPTRPDSLEDVDFDKLDIPRTALVAYQVAANTMRQADPDCGIDWSLVAAIGKVETDHGRHAGASLGSDGFSDPLIRGIKLDGAGPVAAIPDTDSGRLDGDRTWDRAMGPMQFLPSTWGYAGVDADGDGMRSPDNINDAALGAAVYLCAAPGSLDSASGLREAVHRYNPSDEYVDLVTRLAKAYHEGDLAQLPPGGTTLALDALRSGGGTMTAPADSGAPGSRSGNDNGTGNGPGNAGGKSGKSWKDGDDGAPGGKDTDGTRGARVDEPGKPVKGGTGDEPLPDFDQGKDPKPPKDPGPTDAPDPEPVLVEITGILTLLSGEESDDGTDADQWSLTDASIAGETVEDVALHVGDETWLEAPASADLDGDTTVETNHAELAGLVGHSVVVTAEEADGYAVLYSLVSAP
jgi:membrane-bound lytic murein transglycosylase B